MSLRACGLAVIGLASPRDEGAVGLMKHQFVDRAARATAKLGAKTFELDDAEDALLVGPQMVHRLKVRLQRQLAVVALQRDHMGDRAMPVAADTSLSKRQVQAVARGNARKDDVR